MGAKPFLAKYDGKAIWIDGLKPLDGEKFFFEPELEKILLRVNATSGNEHSSAGGGPP